MEIYKRHGDALEVKYFDETNSKDVAFWLSDMFARQHQDIVLAYFSLLLEESVTPLIAARKTLETMGSAAIGSTLSLEKEMECLREEIAANVNYILDKIGVK